MTQVEWMRRMNQAEWLPYTPPSWPTCERPSFLRRPLRQKTKTRRDCRYRAPVQDQWPSEFPRPRSMAAAFVRSWTQVTGVSVTSVNITGIALAAGNLATVHVRITDASTTITSVTDNHSNAYVIGVRKADGPATTETYQPFGVQVSGGTTSITVNFSQACSCRVDVAEFSGLAQTNAAVEGTTSTGTGPSSPFSVTAFSPVAVGDLVVATAHNQGGAGTWTAGSGYTLAGAAASALQVQYRLVGTVSETSPITSTNSATYTVIARTYRLPDTTLAVSPTEVQAKTGTSGSVTTTLPITFDSSTTTGNGILLIARLETTDSSAMSTSNSVAGNSGDTPYTSVIAVSFGTTLRARLVVFFFANITGRSGHIVTLTVGKTCFVSARIIELHNANLTTFVTGTATSNTGSSTAITGGSVTPAANGLQYGVASYDSGGTYISANWASANLEVAPMIDPANAITGALSILVKTGTSGAADNPAWALAASKSWCAVHFVVQGAAQAYTLTAAGGSFAMTGTAATPKKGSLIGAAAGSFALTGIAAALNQGHKVTATPGNYALTGTAASLLEGHKIPAASGSFLWSGSAASLLFARIFSAAPGSFALNGSTVTLVFARAVIAAPGSFLLTGTAAALHATRLLSVAPGVYALTGTAASLSRTRVLLSTAGVYALTGTAAALHATRLLSADAGIFALTGTSATLSRTRLVTATPGAFDLTGIAAALHAARLLGAGVGSFALTGTSATLSRTRLLAAAPGVFIWTGTPATLIAPGAQMVADPGVFDLTGTAASLRAARLATLAPGAFAWTGSPVALLAARTLSSAPGAFQLTGLAASLRRSVRLPSDAGAFVLTGTSIDLRRGFQLTAVPGVFSLTGLDALMTWSGEVRAKIYIVGRYEPTIELTVRYDPSIAITGRYSPAIRLTGSTGNVN